MVRFNTGHNDLTPWGGVGEDEKRGARVIAIMSAELAANRSWRRLYTVPGSVMLVSIGREYARYRLIPTGDLLAKLLKYDYCQCAASGLLVRSFAVVSPVVLAVYHDDTGWSEDRGSVDSPLHCIRLVSMGRGCRLRLWLCAERLGLKVTTRDGCIDATCARCPPVGKH